MISITCTQCQAALSIDDAFAGGVCRCQHCGTIQTVPARKREGAGGTAAGVRAPKTLYQKRTRDASVGTGLDDLADVVTSSGLAASAASSSASSTGAAPARKSHATLLIGIAAIIVIALLVVILVVVSRPRSDATGGAPTKTSGTTSSTPGAGGQGGQASAGEPSFCGIKLDHPSVIYLLDRGSSTQAPFGSLKEAALKSIQSLGAQRRFQIIFWDNGQDPGTFPPLLAFASEANVAEVRRQTEDVFAFGATDPAPALVKAVAQRPAAVVIATGKGADLDDAFVQMVKDTRKDAQVVIHTFAIGAAGQSTALKTVAQSSGGHFRELSEGELSTFGR